MSSVHYTLIQDYEVFVWPPQVTVPSLHKLINKYRWWILVGAFYRVQNIMPIS